MDRLARTPRGGELWQSTRLDRWVPRWARLLDGLEPVPGLDGRSEAASPSDERRLRERQKTLAGAVGAALAAAVVALMVWQGAGSIVRGAVELAGGPAPRGQHGAAEVEQKRVLPSAAPTAMATVSPTAAATAIAVTAVPTTAPAASPVGTAASAVPAASVTPSTTTAVQSEARTHTVEKGDTLFSIARRNGTTVGALVAANGLPGPDAVLSVGRRLVVP